MSATAATVPEAYDATAGRRRRQRLKEIQGFIWSAPFWVGFLLFAAFPMMASAYFSLTHYSALTPPVFRGLGNYIDMLSDPGLLKVTRNTVVYAGLSVPIGMALGLMVALLLNQKVKGLSIWRTIYYLPAVTPTASSAVLWRWILNRDYGVVNQILGVFGIPAINWFGDEFWVLVAYVLIGLWGIGGGLIINLAGLQSIPTDLYDAAEVDGAGRWRKFTAVTLPMMSPVLFYNVVMGITGAMQSFAFFYAVSQVYWYSGTEMGSMYMVHLFQVAFHGFRMGYASAMAWVLFFVILGLTLLVWKISKDRVYYESEWLTG